MAREDDPSRGADTGGETGSGNWWEGPPPPGWTGAWPPPLKPGETYGPNFGQVISDPAASGAVTVRPGQTLDPTTGQLTTPTTTTTPGPTKPPGPTTPGPTGLPSPFTSPFTAPPMLDLGGPAGLSYIPPTPQFHPPAYTAPAPFSAPSMADVVNDPGFAAPLHEGLGAISNSEAARGLWATGGTGKAMQDYAQQYTNRFYGDIYNRAANTYLTNVGTQNVQPYQFAYQAAKDQFAPQILGYTTTAAAGQRQNELSYQNAYQKWLDDFNQKYQTGRYLFDVSNA
jgi:hypothetical protein